MPAPHVNGKGGAGGNPGSTGRQDQVLDRQRQAFELRKGCATYRAIAAVLGVTESTAHGYVVKYRAHVRAQLRQEAKDALEMEVDRCDALQASFWPDAMRVVKMDDRNAASLLRAKAAAGQLVLGVMRHRAELLGLTTREDQKAREADKLIEALSKYQGRPSTGDTDEPIYDA